MTAAFHMVGARPRAVSFGPPITVTYAGTSQSTSAATTYNLPAISGGAADANRWLIAFISFQTGTTLRDLVSVSIGGVAAEIIAELKNTTGSIGQICGIVAMALVPTGTTSVVSLTLTGSASRAGAALFRTIKATKPKFTTVVSALDGSDPASVSVPAVAGGACICFDTGFSSSAMAPVSWTGVTEILDIAYGASAAYFTATLNAAAADTTYNAVATHSANIATGQRVLIGAAVR